jgi:hypothetical protein
MKDIALPPVRHGLADQPDHALARALARSFGEAGRVPRPSRVALPGRALRGSVVALPAQ